MGRIAPPAEGLIVLALSPENRHEIGTLSAVNEPAIKEMNLTVFGCNPIHRRVLSSGGTRPMPSVQPWGAKIRHLRRAIGLTQLELAVRAGVSERVIRKAERNCPVKRELLGYIAEALGVKFQEVVHDPGEIAPLLRWRRNVGTILELVTPYLQTGDPSGFLDVAHRDVEIVCRVDRTLPGAQWFSSSFFSRAEGARRFIDKSLQLKSETVTRLAKAQAPRGGDNIVIMRGTESRSFSNGDQENTWFVRVFDFADGRIRRLDEYVGALEFDWPETPLDERL